MAGKSLVYFLDKVKKKNEQKFPFPKQSRHFSPNWSGGAGP